MSRLAAEHGAINLSQGFPDFEGPQALRDRIAWHMNHGHNQYAPLAGVPELAASRSPSQGGMTSITLQDRPGQRRCAVTPGATEAIYCRRHRRPPSIPGDEAIIIDPSYDTYDPCVRLNGGVPVRVPMTPGFTVDWQRVRGRGHGPKTRMIMINTPHNPTGSVLGEDGYRGTLSADRHPARSRHHVGRGV